MNKEYLNDLRRQAEERLAGRERPIESMERADLTKMAHELAVNYAELEIQNEEIRRARAEVEEARDRYLDLYEHAPVGYFTLDEHSRIVEANLTGCRLLQVDRRNLLNRHFTELIKDDQTDSLYIQLRTAQGKDTRHSFELILQKADGTPFYAQLESIKAGERRLHVTVSDISERKQAEKKTRDQYDILRSIVESTITSLFSVDSNYCYTSFNSSHVATMKSIYGVDIEIGQSLLGYMRVAEDREAARRRLDRVLEGECLTAEAYFGEESPNRSYLTVHHSPVRSADGTVIGAVVLAQDVTDRKRAEEERRKMEKLESIGILAGGIAHDFNNLLTAIMGNIALAGRCVDPQSKAFGSLDEAEKASLRAKDLAQQLLTFSKGGAPIKKTAAISELIEGTAAFSLRGSNVRLELSLPEDLWAVEVDEGQISQVIQNIVMNADEAMPAGGTLYICARNTTIRAPGALPLPEGTYVQIDLKDEGIGMSGEQLARIFEPYYTTKQKGSGLGLATAYSIVKNHKGHITVESTQNVGTTFQICLPASGKPAPAKMKAKEEAPMCGHGRILVMDDEEMVRLLLGKILAGAGYGVELTKDGAEAIEQYASARESGKPFDAVIMDLTIPGGMGGKDAIAKLLEIDPAAKAIVSSGYATDPIMADFKKYGFSAVVAKPYSISGLENTLRTVLAE